MIGHTDAIAEMHAMFLAAWDTQAVRDVVGYVPEVQYSDVKVLAKLTGDKFVARVNVIHGSERQATLSDCVSAPGKRMYQFDGVIIVQLFVPKHVENNIVQGRRLAEIGRNAYRGTASENGIWFRNARIEPRREEELFFRLDVVVDFTHSEVA